MIPTQDEFEALANNIPVLCWLADAAGSIYWYNTQWYEFTGTTTQSMMGWGWQSVHHPRTLPMVLKRWHASLATGAPFEMIFPLRSASGAYLPFLTRVRPVLDARGQVDKWFGINAEVGDMLAGESLAQWNALKAVMEA